MPLVQGLPRAADQALQLTLDTTGATAVAGFLRRPTDGALVGTTSTVGATQQSGFLRGPAPAGQGIGPLVYEDGAAVKREFGLGRTASGALAITTVDPAPAFLQHGLKFGPLGRVYVAVIA